MNTNSNLYTIIYSAVVVILVAAVLSLAYMGLKPRQEANEKAETISQMLTAGKIIEAEALANMDNDDILKEYVKYIKTADLINAAGEKVGELDKENSEIFTESRLKAQNDLIKKGQGTDLAIPVFVFEKDGKKTTVLPCFGAGLWGPIWGYIAYSEDLQTIVGAYFDHASETPGLGAKIKDDPAFQKKFIGKKIDLEDNGIFNIKKNGASENKDNTIDAITGATMTSKGLDVAINNWLGAYKAYLKNAQKEYANSLESTKEADSIAEDGQTENEEA